LGANVLYDAGHTEISGVIAFFALILATINVVGGFAVTNRMLQMIAGRRKRGGD
jgi:NAD(P) transhydrogenase subunit alpha